MEESEKEINSNVGPIDLIRLMIGKAVVLDSYLNNVTNSFQEQCIRLCNKIPIYSQNSPIRKFKTISSTFDYTLPDLIVALEAIFDKNV